MRDHPRSFRVAALATGAIVIVLALAVAMALVDARRTATTPAPAPSVSPVPSATGTPASPTPHPTPLPSGRPVGGIEAYPLGTLHGEYAFVVNGGANTMPGAVGEVWAVSLAGGDAKLAVRFANSTTPRTSTADNVLAHQFSPGSRRLLIGAATPRAAGGERVGLFVVDVETGRVTSVGTDDASEYVQPAWSPDGRRIAYVKWPIVGNGTTATGSDEGVWVMNADGTGARKVPMPRGPQSEFPARTFLYSWTPDGRIAWWYESLENALVFTDVDSGTSTTVRSAVGDARGLSFRTATPRIAGSFSDKPGNCPGNFIAVLDGAPERVLVRETGGVQCSPRIHDVRWSPTRDEVLYVAEIAPKAELHIHDLGTGDQRIATGMWPVLPEWTVDGSHIVYIDRTAQQQSTLPLHGEELRSIARDGTGDRVLFVPPRDASLSDLATRAYP